MSMPPALRICAITLLAAGLPSCLSTQPTTRAPEPAPTRERIELLPIMDAGTGGLANWADVVEATLDADVILLAELHGHPLGLPYHAEILRDSLSGDANAALCLEFITRDWQYLLDAWAEGIVDWDGVQEALSTAPSNTARDHRPLIEMAHEFGMPVLAANSPRIYTRAAKASGYEALAALSDEQQRLFQIPAVLPSGDYRDGFYKMMSGFDEGHGAFDTEGQDAASGESGEPFVPSDAVIAKFRSQGLWDGTMSDTVLGALDAGANRVFLVVGSYHANNDGGIVQVLRERRPELKVLVVSFVADDAPDFDDEEAKSEYVGMADFVTFVGPYPSRE